MPKFKKELDLQRELLYAIFDGHQNATGMKTANRYKVGVSDLVVKAGPDCHIAWIEVKQISIYVKDDAKNNEKFMEAVSDLSSIITVAQHNFLNEWVRAQDSIGLVVTFVQSNNHIMPVTQHICEFQPHVNSAGSIDYYEAKITKPGSTNACFGRKKEHSSCMKRAVSDVRAASLKS